MKYVLETWSFEKPERHEVHKGLSEDQFEISPCGFVKIKIPDMGLAEQGYATKRYYLWTEGYGPKTKW
jgi:hypothetical protein